QGQGLTLAACSLKALFHFLPALSYKTAHFQDDTCHHGIIFAFSIPGKSVKGVAMNLTAELGSIQIRNGSIMITCDGLYLVSLKGYIFFSDLEEEDLLKLTLQKTGKATSLALWEQPFQDRDTPVNLTTVLYLFDEDNITLLTNSDATIKDLSFSFLLLTPFTCPL
uniref:Tumor necrosis factor ligand superfamily member 4 n=1 Tax=Falco tinnunculus TaxID=100819 RepID=A0A8C4XIU8_FALTI